MNRPRMLALAGAVMALAVVPAAAQAATPRSGVQHLKFRYGPIAIKPGQNNIVFEANRLMPKVDGWITSFKPDLVRADGKAPPVDVIHLHHAVWLVNAQPVWAAGEEKTVARLPRGFGWRHSTEDSWILNHMIHNLTANPDRVWITWEMDFVPATARAAKSIKEIRTQWLDVMGIRAYPVFDVLRGTGRNGRYTYPDDAPAPAPRTNRWVVDRDGTLVATGGHLHPGGLYTDLKLTRGSRTVRLFRSRARYYEPAGAVSWDVSMTITRPDWRVAVRKGDVLSVSGTYDSSRRSWYESMTIMPTAMTVEPAGGVDPFRTRVDRPGVLTHGHLPENDNHGGEKGVLNDARTLPDGPRTDTVTVDGFLYRQGGLSWPRRDRRALPPVISPGSPLRFFNADAARDVMHSITSCRLPCTATTGIAYPLADGPVTFDSGNLGFGPAGYTPAANRDTWQTPPNLSEGTYAYFCRVHPFMRGAFRVKR